MPNFQQVQNRKRDLIRKITDASGFLTSADGLPILRITDDAGALLPLPTGGGNVRLPWDDLGYLTGDGIAHSREVSTSDVTSLGQQAPTRSDITTDTATITLACQETKLMTVGLATGVETSTLKPAAGGEVVIRKPARPSPQEYRFLSLGVDQNAYGEIYIAHFFPRVKVTSFSDQPFASGDEALLWGVTLTAQLDDALGYSQSTHFGGPGWNAILEEAGFPPAASVTPGS